MIIVGVYVMNGEIEVKVSKLRRKKKIVKIVKITVLIILFILLLAYIIMKKKKD